MGLTQNELHSAIPQNNLHNNPTPVHGPDESELEMEQEEEAPPGYPIKIFHSSLREKSNSGTALQTETTLRRSNRLSEKNTGTYISTIEKAQITQGYTTTASPPPTKAKTRAKVVPVKLTYQESHDPLSAIQAEALVYTAGIELGEELAAKIQTLIETGQSAPSDEGI